MSFIGIILAIIILSILVIVHEFGHFLLARKNGIMVKEFSIGFGPRIISIGKGETKFSWKAIPFGGSCTMLGAFEDEDDDTDDERSYDKKSVWARMSVTLAGPFFNFLLAFILAIIVTGTIGYDPSSITAVEKSSPAYEAGLREGDVITKYNGEVINFGREIYLEDYIHPISSNEPVEVSYVRGGEKFNTTIIPEEYQYYLLGISYQADENKAEITEIVSGSAVDKAGLRDGDVIKSINGTEIGTGSDLAKYFEKNEVTSEALSVTFTRRGIEKEAEIIPKEATGYKMGFTYNLANEKTNAGGTLKYSLAELRYEILSVYKSIAFLFSDRGSLDMLSGPVGIVQIVGDTYDSSVSYGFTATLMNILGLMILFSVNLGVLNLLPLPALDGGKFILLVIEAIRRKPINRKYEGAVTVVFAVLLMILAVVVLVNDITKFF